MTVSQFIGGGPVDVEYIELSAYNSGADNYSIASNWGSVEGGRKVYIAVHVLAGTGVTLSLSSASIGGVTATLIHSFQQVSGADLTMGVFWIAAAGVPGTSGNVAVAFSAAVGVQLGIWKVMDCNMLAARDTASLGWNSTSTSPRTINLDAKANGAVFAAATLRHDGANPDFTAGVAEDYTGLGSGAFRVIGGFSLTTADEANRAIELTKTTGANWVGGFNAISIR